MNRHHGKSLPLHVRDIGQKSNDYVDNQKYSYQITFDT